MQAHSREKEAHLDEGECRCRVRGRVDEAGEKALWLCCCGASYGGYSKKLVEHDMAQRVPAGHPLENAAVRTSPCCLNLPKGLALLLHPAVVVFAAVQKHLRIEDDCDGDDEEDEVGNRKGHKREGGTRSGDVELGL